MLHSEDRQEVARRFGADDEQITRDHLISHLLVGLAEIAADDVVFFGGTALSRTHLPRGRLSEDIDLYTSANRREVAANLTEHWARTVRREYPRLIWRTALDDVRDVEAASLVSEEGAVVRVQLLTADASYRRWPTEPQPMEMRYRDVPPARLTVPTRGAFVGMKAAAWGDRHTARDLFDLAALADIGAIDDDAIELLYDVTGATLVQAELSALPPGIYWEEQLAHQCRLDLGAEAALQKVRESWSRAAGW